MHPFNEIKISVLWKTIDCIWMLTNKYSENFQDFCVCIIMATEKSIFFSSQPSLPERKINYAICLFIYFQFNIICAFKILNQQLRFNLQLTHYFKILFDLTTCRLIFFQSKEFFVWIYMLFLVLIIHLEKIDQVGNSLVFQGSSHYDLGCTVILCLFWNVLS